MRTIHLQMSVKEQFCAMRMLFGEYGRSREVIWGFWPRAITNKVNTTHRINYRMESCNTVTCLCHQQIYNVIKSIDLQLLTTG
jgi:hypothetical protein